mgnify:CR=1 FL=1
MSAEMELIAAEVQAANAPPVAVAVATTRSGAGGRSDRTATHEAKKSVHRQKSSAVRKANTPSPPLSVQSNADQGRRAKLPSSDALRMLGDAAQAFEQAPTASIVTRSSSRKRCASSSASLAAVDAPTTSRKKRKRQTSMPVHRVSESPQEMKERRKAEMVAYQAELQGAIKYLHQTRRFSPPGAGPGHGMMGFAGSGTQVAERAMRYSPRLMSEETLPCRDSGLTRLKQ